MQAVEKVKKYLSDTKPVYWYNCDGYDDRGWGCGWRVMQTTASLLYDRQVTFTEIDEELIKLGFETKTKEGRLAFVDVGWISEYFRCCFGGGLTMFVPTDFPSLETSLINMSNISDPKVIVLVCGGMIVCMDDIEGNIGHFIDPHVYDDTVNGKIPRLIQLGKGGIGLYSIPQLMKDILEVFCENIEDEVLRKEILSSLEFVSPCFLVITSKEAI